MAGIRSQMVCDKSKLYPFAVYQTRIELPKRWEKERWKKSAPWRFGCFCCWRGTFASARSGLISLRKDQQWQMIQQLLKVRLK